jgi:hypothetical protein
VVTSGGLTDGGKDYQIASPRRRTDPRRRNVPDAQNDPGLIPVNNSLAANPANAYNVYDLGTTTAGPSSNIYRICWGHNLNIGFQVGSFQISGPFTMDSKDLICTLTEKCFIQLTGMGLASTNTIRVMESSMGSCGDDVAGVSTFTGLQPLLNEVIVTEGTTGTPPTPTYELYVMTNDANGLFNTTAPAPNYANAAAKNELVMSGNVGVQRYRICFSFRPTSPPPAPNPEFMYSIGEFTLHGPETHAHVDCPMTVPCLVQLTGVNLLLTNKARVLGTGGPCDTDAPITDGESYNGVATGTFPTGLSGTGNFPSFDVSVSTSSDNRTYDFGTTTAGLASLEYQLCWAHDSNYAFSVATFQISGPYTRKVNETQCTLTLTCTLQITGVGLASTNGLRIIDSNAVTNYPWCGGAAGATFQGLDSTKQVKDEGLFDKYEVASGANGITEGIAGGLYQVCWAHLHQGNNADYKFALGTFVLNGPLIKTLSCPMTVNCFVQLTGTGLAATNRAKIVASGTDCSTGAATPSDTHLGIFPNYNDTAVFPSFDVAVNNSIPYDYYILGTTTVGLASSNFHLCWAFEHPHNYVFDVGEFTFAGPFTTDALECTLTETCLLQLTGIQLASTNGIRILDTTSGALPGCGDSDDGAGLTTITQLTSTTQVNDAGIYDTYHVAANPTTTGTAGNFYRVCWGHLNQNQNTDYKFQVGQFTLNGPLVMSNNCPMTALCVVQVTGTGLESTNNAKVVASGTACTTNAVAADPYTGGSFDVPVGSSPHRTFNLGTTTAGPASVNWVLCWAHDTNYVFEIGSFQVSGPYTEATSTGKLFCTLTETCSLQLTGVGLEVSNTIRILESALKCVDGELGVSTFAGLAHTTSVTNAAGFDVYAVSTGAGSTEGTSGVLYRLCWSHSPTQDTDYSFDVGRFTLNGPLEMTNNCPMTASCVVQVTGTGLAASNKAKVVSDDQTCNNAATIPTTYTGGSFNVDVGTTPFDTFNLGTTTAGLASTDYHLCWANDAAIPSGSVRSRSRARSRGRRLAR